MDFTKPINELTVAFDFDWTLCEYPTLLGAGIANDQVLFFLKKFLEAGANVSILTARDNPSNPDYEKYDWNRKILNGNIFSVKRFLEYYGVGEVPVYFTNGQPKGPYLDRLDVDLLIDDSKHEHESAQAFGRKALYPEDVWLLAGFFNR